MSEEVTNPQVESEEISDEQALLKLAQAMKDNTPSQEEKQNVHTFLTKVIEESETLRVAKLGNLRDDKQINELGVPTWNVRGALEMARISDKLMDNTFFKDFFEASSNETNSTSLSREGFMIKVANSQTKNVADVTHRKKIRNSLFGKKTIEESGGDNISRE